MNWYVLKSKHRKESSLCSVIKTKEIEFYCPEIRSRTAISQSHKMKPLFPGYIFVRFDIDECGKNYFRWIPFSGNLINIGGEPAIVPDNIIHAIKQKIDVLNHHETTSSSKFKSGDQVKINDGPFQGYHAIFDMQLSSNDRVRVLLQLIGENKIPLILKTGQLSMKNYS